MLHRTLDLAPIDTALVFLTDTLDWLNLWHRDAGELDNAQPDSAPNHLFPQP